MWGGRRLEFVRIRLRIYRPNQVRVEVTGSDGGLTLSYEARLDRPAFVST